MGGCSGRGRADRGARLAPSSAGRPAGLPALHACDRRHAPCAPFRCAPLDARAVAGADRARPGQAHALPLALPPVHLRLPSLVGPPRPPAEGQGPRALCRLAGRARAERGLQAPEARRLAAVGRPARAAVPAADQGASRPDSSSRRVCAPRADQRATAAGFQDLMSCTPEDDPEHDDLLKVMALVDNGPSSSLRVFPLHIRLAALTCAHPTLSDGDAQQPPARHRGDPAADRPAPVVHQHPARLLARRPRPPPSQARYIS